MCGIFGGYFAQSPTQLSQRLAATMQALHHRGPDDHGYVMLQGNFHGQCILGHTRLSIIDLSDHAHQPLYSADKRFCLVFNGEIYNYRELRAELIQLGHTFFTQSDTEVLLMAWCVWGRQVLSRLVGMFAFVIYDQYEQTLTCVRDAFGIKPFFYQYETGYFGFASEPRALLVLGNQRPQIDWQRSYDYLAFGDYESKEDTFYAGIKSLLPGQIMCFSLKHGKVQVLERWWQPQTKIQRDITFPQAAEALREQFLENVRLHLRSDVPVGAALSGGLDSSAIVCAMRYLEPNKPIHTFSFIAEQPELSEKHWVNRINNIAGTSSHFISAGSHDLVQDLDDMVLAQGEPFGSTSIYAQYCLFRHVNSIGIKVILDGQGADELLGGYYGYPGERLLSLLEQRQFSAMLQFLRQWKRWPGRSYKQAILHLGRVTLPDTLYHYGNNFIGRCAHASWLNIKILSAHGVLFQEQRFAKDRTCVGRRVIERLANSIRERGLPALLRHADRNSMRFSVENRVPFLTVPIANFLLSLPEEYLISSQGETKSIFRAAMRDIVPDAVLDRRDKIGFATPEREWLLNSENSIRAWLSECEDIPLFCARNLLREFDAVISGSKPYTWQVWRWLNYVRWYALCIA